MVSYWIYLPFCWDKKNLGLGHFLLLTVGQQLWWGKWMDAPFPLFLSTLLCSLEQHSLLDAHSTRMKKNCFQLGLGRNPFSHSTYIWREGTTVLPSVGSILLPTLTQGTTWSFNKFTSKSCSYFEPHITCVARTSLTFHLKLGFKMNFLAGSLKS